MELVDLYTLLLMLYFGAVTNAISINPKCQKFTNFFYCKNLIATDYPLVFPQSNDTFSLKLTNTENLPDDAISGIQIEELDIVNSPITTIAENAFAGHEDTLKVLKISTLTKKVPAPTKSLESLYNLEELKISNFMLNTSVNDINFTNLSRLQSLHLEDNSLHHFDKPVFKGLSSLTKLIITRNNFEFIPLPSIFGDLSNLTILDMRENQITKITGYNLQKNTNLKQIILEQNALAEIEKDAFKGMENSLEVLDLKINKLNYSHLIHIGEILSLRDLNLMSNRIKTLTNGIFKNLKSLQVLNLRGNGLSNLKNGSLLGLSRLETLLLDSNNMAVEAGTLSDTPQLQEIWFKNQGRKLLQMEWLQDAADSLLKLYLDQNTFNDSSLWLVIQSLRKLEYLSLSKCNLVYIPDFAFEQNRQLQTLKLGENKLQFLRQETFQGLQESLVSIDLKSNSLQTIDECVFQQFNWSLRQEVFPVNLDQNDLVCNCSSLWLKEWLQTYLAGRTQLFYPIPYVPIWKCSGSNEFIYKVNLTTCDSNSTNQTCQDFSDRYTIPTTMAPITTAYPTTFAETTEISTTLLRTTTTAKTTFIITTIETTLKTTKTTQPPTTTIAPTTTPPPKVPSLSLLLEKLSPSSISITWNISSWEHVQQLTLIIDKNIENVGRTVDKILLFEMDPTIRNLDNLPEGTILNVCIQPKLDFPSKLVEECDIIRLLRTQKVQGEDVGIKIGIGVGVAILITLILSLLGLLWYSRRKSKIPIDRPKSGPSLNEPMTPKMTPKSKRYKKKKNPNGEPEISVISREPFQPMPRISAGSYQYLADPNLESNSKGQPQVPRPGSFDNKAFTASTQDLNVRKETDKNQPGGYDNRAFIESLHEYNVPDEYNVVDEYNFPDEYDVVDEYNVIDESENNNDKNKAPTERPLPNLPGSQNFIQYFQPDQPVYENVQSHYAEIPHSETVI